MRKFTSELVQAVLLAAVLSSHALTAAAADAPPVAEQVSAAPSHDVVKIARRSDAAHETAYTDAKFTVEFSGEASVILARIAKEAGLEYSQPETTGRSFPVHIAVRNVSLDAVLASIGAQLGRDADLVLEDARIELHWAPPAAAPKADAESKVLAPPHWTVGQGSQIRATLESWASEAGWVVVWVPTEVDLTAGISQTYYSSFDTAVKRMFAAIPFDSLAPSQRLSVDLRTDNNPPLVYVFRDDGVKK
jgi:hypothetical protein